MSASVALVLDALHNVCSSLCGAAFNDASSYAAKLHCSHRRTSYEDIILHGVACNVVGCHLPQPGERQGQNRYINHRSTRRSCCVARRLELLSPRTCTQVRSSNNLSTAKMSMSTNSTLDPVKACNISQPAGTKAVKTCNTSCSFHLVVTMACCCHRLFDTCLVIVQKLLGAGVLPSAEGGRGDCESYRGKEGGRESRVRTGYCTRRRSMEQWPMQTCLWASSLSPVRRPLKMRTIFSRV